MSHLANPNGIINLSINPWYFCNFRCEFCYLTPEQLGDRQLLDLATLKTRLDEIVDSGHSLGHADIYGGEVMLLPKGYMREMKELLQEYGVTEIEVITNLSALNKEVVEDLDFGISVSYDFSERERHEEVFNNMLKLDRPFTILTLATPDVCKLDVEDMLIQLSMLGNLIAWEIKPYSTNQANQAVLPFTAFENLVQRVLEAPIPRHYEFLNEKLLRQAIRDERNSFSDDHLYITPKGNFAVLEFDANDNEFFLELSGIEAYLEWTMIEKGRVYDNGHCGVCDYMGKCLSEHLRKVDNIDESCNGFYHLIKWAEKTWN